MNLFPRALPEETGLDANLTEAINRMSAEHIEKGMTVCESVTVICKDKTVYENYAGYANAEKKTPLRKDHLFRMASMTKPITAVCIMKQMEEGKLELDDPVGKYIPCMMNMNVADFDGEGKCIGSHASPRPFTVRDLLSHSSGLGSGIYTDNLGCSYSIPKNGVLGDMMEPWSKSLLGFDPGSMGQYSWLLGFDVLAHIVELTSDMPYADFAKEKISILWI